MRSVPSKRPGPSTVTVPAPALSSPQDTAHPQARDQLVAMQPQARAIRRGREAPTAQAASLEIGVAGVKRLQRRDLRVDDRVERREEQAAAIAGDAGCAAVGGDRPRWPRQDAHRVVLPRARRAELLAVGEALERPRRAAGDVGVQDVVAGARHRQQLPVRQLGQQLLGVLHRRARVEAAAEQQRRDVGQRRGRRRRRRVAQRPAQAVVGQRRVDHRRAAERRERTVGHPVGAVAPQRPAIGIRREQGVGELHVGACRGDVERRAELGRRHRRALRQAAQPQQRCRVAGAAALIAPGSAACRNGLRSPDMMINNSSDSSWIAVSCGAPCTSGILPRSGAWASLRASAPRSATGSLVAWRQRSAAHCSARMRGSRAEGVQEVGVDAVGTDDGVEDQPLGARRELPRVLHRDVGAVADAHQRELRCADRAAQRLDVGHRVDRRVELARRAQRVGARLDDLGVDDIQRAQRLQRRAAQRARRARAALVEQHQPPVRERGRQRRTEGVGESHRGLPRAAREGQQEPVSTLARALDRHRQLHGSGHLSGAIQRDHATLHTGKRWLWRTASSSTPRQGARRTPKRPATQ